MAAAAPPGPAAVLPQSERSCLTAGTGASQPSARLPRSSLQVRPPSATRKACPFSYCGALIAAWLTLPADLCFRALTGSR
eukprot:4540588-Prymnesium_polylepis.1